MMRDQLLAAVATRLERITAAQDPSMALKWGASRDAKRLEQILRDDDGDVEARVMLGWFRWYQYWALPEGRDHEALSAAIRALTPCFIAGVDGLPEPLLPLLAERAFDAAVDLLAQARRTSGLSLITVTVSLWRRIVNATPAADPDRALYLSNLCAALGVRFGRSGKLADLDEAITAGRAAVQAAALDNPNRAMYLSNLGAALRSRFGQRGSLTDMEEAISVSREAVRVAPADHSELANYLSNLGSALQTRFGQVGELTDLDEAITVGQSAVQAAPADHPDRAIYLSNLSIALQTRFRQRGSLADLAGAIDTGRESVQAIPADHPDQPLYLSNLGTTLQTRFGRVGELADLDEAIAAARGAVQAAPDDHPNQAMYLSCLSGALHRRFRRLGSLADLEEAIEAGRESVQVAPAGHPDRAMYLSNLSTALQSRFRRLGALTDLDEAIAVGQSAMQAAPANHPSRAMYLSNLSAALGIRFGRVGVLADLDEAIAVGQSAVQAAPLDHPDRAMYLSNLGINLKMRFGRMGVLADLDEAIAVGQSAAQAAPLDHPDRAMYLSNLGITLRTRFDRVGKLAELDESIAAGQSAVQAAPLDHPDRAMYLSNICAALQTRFERVGALADLDEAITAGRAARRAAPADHPDRAKYLSVLSIALGVRFERVGDLADLEEAIRAGQDAVQATLTDHPDQAMYLGNLCTAFLKRFERVGDLADLEEAIRAGREAVQAIPADHPDWAGRLSNLGAALRVRFARVGTIPDLEEAITAGRAAVQATPADHVDRARHLVNLSVGLLTRFGQLRTATDLEEGISVAREALSAIPADHSKRVGCLSNLGFALWVRFGRTGAQADLDEAVSTYIQAAEVVSGAPSLRIRAARSATSLAVKTDTRRVADLLETAVLLLPETAPRQLHRGDQQHALSEFAGLANDAASLALLAGEVGPSGENPATRALRLLELGRGVMLSQTLDTRSDLTELQARHPVLAARFTELRDRLDQAGDTSVFADDAGTAVAWGERRIEDRHQLVTVFNTTVAEIRSLDGFETFLLPPEADQLIRQARNGPVVMLNVSQYSSDAILLRPGGITSIPLPDLAHSTVRSKISSFRQTLDVAHDPDASADQRSDAQDTLSAVLEWLWDAAGRPILDELGYRHTPEPGAVWPRLWWIPGGLLSLLPLHAAGYHRKPSGPDDPRTVMDRVISSYTPTVRALGYARERNTASTAAERALIVAMPTTPGIDSPLRYVIDEAELVHTRLPGSTLLIEDPAADEAHTPSKANVLAHLDDCAIVHFACHGSSDPADPSRNLLLLHDHDVDPLTVASLAPIRLDQARLAYLSACWTAFNPSAELADEAIHLTTAFQLAGYPHVVGTLWEVDDELAVRVADTFYTVLAIRENTIDVSGAARALHHTVCAIRDESPATPSLWAAYLHAGA